ncbi:hypothetical protein QCN29_05110 [Streptomyces sp. HNM0663]|uniref:DUF7848 domain-containing protein n=1 Tax=Streptomyces chengmaiensis TaxID=3040919 RepID=A0ABT6HHL9_9ACTN|nr:hypothetical protein [Streptomyces chengmaiensis]MDH2388178.1 hypothetical protein [Streptomyces chengmaiensis]
MSTDGTRTRRRYAFIDWTLTADTEAGLRFVAKCMDCGESCTDTSSSDEAQVWCLKHAGLTGDRTFELIATQAFTAAPTEELSATRC